MPKLRFSVTAGRAIRRQVKREIVGYCHARGVDCQVREDRGWLDSEFYFTLSHPDSVKMIEVGESIERWLKRQEQESA